MASISKYNGLWDAQTAAHLLRRTTYGVPRSVVLEFANIGLDKAINRIFEPVPLPEPPLNLSFADDPNTPIGQTWVDKLNSSGANNYRNVSMRWWSINQLVQGVPNIKEKMTMFWHNHFVVADINNDARLNYYYIQLLRTHAVGNFRQLTKEITVDPAMLNYLNGRENSNVAPNENYARELMELFTLGKGEVAGPGDYTTFTETDVKELAKALTGWVDVRTGNKPMSNFRVGRHDTTTKKLSPRFNNATISNAGENEYKNVIDLIFLREEVALFLTRKIYRWFASPEITPEIEADIIKPLADIFRLSNYEMEPMLRKLLSSEHFYDTCVRGSLIKNPIDYVANLVNSCHVTLSSDPIVKSVQLVGIYTLTSNLQMGIFLAPNVAGWTPFYQEPAMDALWLNSSTLPARKTFTDAIASVGIGTSPNKIKINHLAFLKTLPTPDNIDALIDEAAAILFVEPIAANQKEEIRKNTLINWNAADWKNAYEAHLSDPTNEAKRQPLVTRLTIMLVYMMRMPEYHLS
jgi:uncharacterized protein (DUF1800 family)